MSRRASDSSVGKGTVLANRYRIVKKLGKGNYGIAWLCADIVNKKEKKVVKEIRMPSQSPEDTIEDQREAAILRQLEHPAIVKFFDSFPETECFCIVCEYCEGGDIEALIKKYKKEKIKFPEQQVVEWLVQILLGVQYLHDQKFLHRDLKPGNLFLKNNMIKIADFGISRRLMDTEDMASTFAGTPIYMSPELANKCTYNYKSDIWAVGCILYEMVTLVPAFDIKTWATFFSTFSKPSKLPKWPEDYSKDLKDIFEILCSYDAKERPSAAYLISSPYILGQIKMLRDNMSKKLKEKKRKSRSESPDGEAKPVNQLEWKNKTPTERMKLRSNSQEASQKGIASRGSWCDGELDSDEEGDMSTLDVDDVTASLIQTFNKTLCGEPDFDETT